MYMIYIYIYSQTGLAYPERAIFVITMVLATCLGMCTYVDAVAIIFFQVYYMHALLRIYIHFNICSNNDFLPEIQTGWVADPKLQDYSKSQHC